MPNQGPVFGFDLGTNSIGWAVLHQNGDGDIDSVVDLGVRIFNKAVEDKTSRPKNQKRRAARLARRVVQRRARRRSRLQNYLIRLGLLPDSVRDPIRRESELNALGDPYQLRAQALDEVLPPHQLGRALLHVGMRRGFQSNRKTLLSDMAEDPDVLEALAEWEQEGSEGKSEADKQRIKEEGEYKAEISLLQKAVEASGARTLGEFLARLPTQERKRNRRTGREMLRHELRAILNAQAPHHPVLNEGACQEIEHIVFFQRPIKWRSDTIGNCSLEPNRRRAARGRTEYQRFRILQDLNNIRYDYPHMDPETGEVLGLNIALKESDRGRLLDKLERQRSMTWGAIRKEIGLAKTQVKFNLEVASKDKGLTGNATSCSIRAILGDKVWEDMGAQRQAELVEDLLKFEKKSPLKTRLIHRWGFDVRTAIALATLELEPGYGNLSLKAIRRILPFLEQGMIYSNARQAAGYTYELVPTKELDRLPPPEDLRNPVVNKALHEFRRICNALIKTYGKPASIRIELPRELTMNRKRKLEYERQQKENKTANDEAREHFRTVSQQAQSLNLPEYPSRNDLIKYRCWKSQNGTSAYSGRAIGLTQLFSAAVEVDHILPYARSLDDSFMNKVVAFAEENAAKGNRTPYEAFAGEPERWEQILQQARHLPWRKQENIRRTELQPLEDFIGSQLSDTGYISSQVSRYASNLGCDVSVSKGVLTAWLRHQWGLNSLLQAGGEKNRTDHRHHAIDAAVTASVSRRFYHGIVHLAERQLNGGSPDSIALPPPFHELRSALHDKLAHMIVVHDPIHKLTGAFHELTAYGAQKTESTERIVYRKPLTSVFDEKQIAKVLDPTLRERLSNHLALHGNDPKVAFSEANRPRLHSGAGRVRHVRVVAAESYTPGSFLVIRNQNGKPLRLHPFGNNHHVEILRDTASGKYSGRFVTTWEAAQRARHGDGNLIQRDHGAGTEFVMALHINDMVELDVDGRSLVYRVQQLDPTGNRIVLRHQHAATLDNNTQRIIAGITPLMASYKCRFLKTNILGQRRND